MLEAPSAHALANRISSANQHRGLSSKGISFQPRKILRYSHSLFLTVSIIVLVGVSFVTMLYKHVYVKSCFLFECDGGNM